VGGITANFTFKEMSQQTALLNPPEYLMYSVKP